MAARRTLSGSAPGIRRSPLTRSSRAIGLGREVPVDNDVRRHGRPELNVLARNRPVGLDRLIHDELKEKLASRKGLGSRGKTEARAREPNDVRRPIRLGHLYAELLAKASSSLWGDKCADLDESAAKLRRVRTLHSSRTGEHRR